MKFNSCNLGDGKNYRLGNDRIPEHRVSELVNSPPRVTSSRSGYEQLVSETGEGIGTTEAGIILHGRRIGF